MPSKGRVHFSYGRGDDETITYFFELLLAKESLATAMQNKTNADRFMKWP